MSNSPRTIPTSESTDSEERPRRYGLAHLMKRKDKGTLLGRQMSKRKGTWNSHMNHRSADAVNSIGLPCMCSHEMHDDYKLDKTLLGYMEEIEPQVVNKEASYHYVEPLPHYLHLVVNQGFISEELLMGFTDPYIMIQYGPLKEFTLPTTVKKGFHWKSSHLFSTLKVLTITEGRSHHLHDMLRQRSVNLGLKLLQDRLIQLRDGCGSNVAESYEANDLQIRLMAWNKVVGYQPLGVISIPVQDIPGHHAPVGEYEPQPKWYLLEEGMQNLPSMPLDQQPNQPALQLSAWFDDLIEPEVTAPVVGKLRIGIQSVTLKSPSKHTGKLRCPYVVLKYDRHWARLPLIHGNTVEYKRLFTFDVRDASTIFKIGVFDANKLAKFRGMVQIRISTLPNNQPVLQTMKLLVRKEGVAKCDIKEKGSIDIWVEWSHDTSTSYLAHYLKPTKPKKFYSKLFREFEGTLEKQHEALVAAYLRNHEPPLPSEVVTVMLCDSFASFNMTTAKIQVKRFGQAMKKLGILFRAWGTVTSWDNPWLTIVAFAIYCWAVFFPLHALQLLILSMLCLLLYGRLHRGQVEDQWTPDLSLFPDRKKPGDSDSDDGIDEARMHSFSPFYGITKKVENAEKFAFKFQLWTGNAASQAERLLGFLGYGCYDNSVGLLVACMLILLLLWVTFLPMEPLFLFAGFIQFRPPHLRSGTGGFLMHLMTRIPTRQDRIIPPTPKWNKS